MGMFVSGSSTSTGSFGSVETAGNSIFSGNVTTPKLILGAGDQPYLTEGASNSLKVDTGDGYIQIGPLNATYAHIYTDRTAGTFFDKDINLESGKSVNLGGYGSYTTVISDDGATFGGEINSDHHKITTTATEKGLSIQNTNLASALRSLELYIDSNGKGCIRKTSASGLDNDLYIQPNHGDVYFPGSGDVIFTNTLSGSSTSTGSFGYGYIDTRLGIGSIPTGEILKVEGGSWNTSLTIQGSGASSGIRFKDSDGNTDSYIYSTGGAISLMDPGGDHMIHAVNDDSIRFASGGSEKMRILNTGNVGIGTTAPSQTLTVAGNISASGDYYVQDLNAIVGESRLQISSSNSQIYTATEFSFNIKSSGNFSIISGSSIPFKVHDTTGEVVLGTQGFTNETGNKLTVYGDSHFSGSSMFSGSIVVGGDDDVHLDIIQGPKFGQYSTQTSALNVYKDSGNSTDGVAHFVNSEAVVNSDDFILRLEYDDERTVESTHDFIQFHDQDGEVGSINSEVAYSTFTGAHVSQRPSGSDFSNWKPGMVVNSTGNIVYTSSISNAWPEVELTTTQKDKAVMGVFAYTGSVKIISSLDNNLPSIHYNAIGEGKVLVTDTNGNIETGDYICSSTRTGHGEKQDEVYLANFTVAKATQPYNFTSASNDADLGYKSVLIACTYHCG